MNRPKSPKLNPTRKPANIGRRRQRDVGEIRHGTVGWEDGGDHFDLESEGVPLLKVTLFAGHNTETQGRNTDPKRAKGLQILARFDGKSSDIPNDGEHVIVARPADMETAPGSYYVIGRTMPDPKWIPNRKSGEKLIQGPNDSFIRIKQDGTLYIFVKAGEGDTGRPVQIELSADGFRINHPHGEAYCDTDGFGMSHSSGAAFSGGAIAGLPAPLDAFSSFLNMRAATVRLNAQAVVLGPQGGLDNLMRATPTLSTLDAMQAEIVALQACIAGVITDFTTALLPSVATTAAAGIATTVITAGAAALTACHTYGPTQSCTGS